MADEVKVSTGEPGPNDVVFDCTNCGRSLCIDSVAAGFSIVCPHCNSEQSVPGEMAGLGPEEGEATDEAVESGGMDELLLQREQLENMLAVQQGRLEQISREMALIQAAIDRIVGLLQDAQAGSPDDLNG